ncbi:Uncharacterised protein [uncultured archaeon]|nr:Uncharacterised protein [uncultured archaeon]
MSPAASAYPPGPQPTSSVSGKAMRKLSPIFCTEIAPEICHELMPAKEKVLCLRRYGLLAAGPRLNSLYPMPKVEGRVGGGTIAPFRVMVSENPLPTYIITLPVSARRAMFASDDSSNRSDGIFPVGMIIIAGRVMRESWLTFRKLSCWPLGSMPLLFSWLSSSAKNASRSMLWQLSHGWSSTKMSVGSGML